MRKMVLISVLLFMIASACGSGSSPKRISIEPLNTIQSTTTSSTTIPVTVSRTSPPTTRKYITQQTKPPVVQGANTGDFMFCVRQKESSNNYVYNDGTYQGAYNMTPNHWGKRGGFLTADKAPPEMQDQKFREDMAQGRDYMHQQYPNSSRACGLK